MVAAVARIVPVLVVPIAMTMLMMMVMIVIRFITHHAHISMT